MPDFRVVEPSREVVQNCDECARVVAYEPGVCGEAWIIVDVHDAGAGSTLGASFCSLACLVQFFLAAENVDLARGVPEPSLAGREVPT